LKDPDAAYAETQRFVASFIRPHGMDRPATPIAADAIEEIGRLGRSEPVEAPAWAPIVRPALLAVGGVATATASLLKPQPAKRFRKQWRRTMKELF